MPQRSQAHVAFGRAVRDARLDRLLGFLVEAATVARHRAESLRHLSSVDQ